MKTKMLFIILSGLTLAILMNKDKEIIQKEGKVRLVRNETFKNKVAAEKLKIKASDSISKVDIKNSSNSLMKYKEIYKSLSLEDLELELNQNTSEMEKSGLIELANSDQLNDVQKKMLSDLLIKANALNSLKVELILAQL